MSVRLVNPILRRLIFAFTVCVFLCVTYAAGLAWYADVLANSPQISDKLRAARLEPRDADYWYRLGVNQQFDLENSSSTQAISYLLKATDLNPRSADYWIALAGAYESAGDLTQARQSYLRAVSEYPVSSEVHWRYGNFLIRQDESSQAYKEIHLALGIDPRLTSLAITRVWRATQNVDDLLTQVLPDDEEAQEQALDWFCNQNDVVPATAVWGRMVASGQPIPIKAVFPLVVQLIAAARGDDARKVWHQAVVANGNPAEAKASDSLVFNGGFEFDSANGGLDWHLDTVTGAAYSYDTAAPHSGSRSLHASFDGNQNLAFNGVWQDVPVEPNTKYHFEGYLRTAGITTESGPRFLIAFVGGQQPQIMLDGLTGDQPWHLEEADFTTGPEAHAVRIFVSRQPSQRFNNKLAGSVWVDDVSLKPAGGPAKP